METIAVYWEEQIKVYGISHRYSLCLATLSFPHEKLASWGERLATFTQQAIRFELVTCNKTDQLVEIHLIVEEESMEALKEAIAPLIAVESTAKLSASHLVDLLFLHGPHFHDRFGIVDVALSALDKENVEVSVSGCAGTSMYLALPGGTGPRAKDILSATFLIPTSG